MKNNVNDIIFATNNKNKFKEISNLINEKFNLLSLRDINFSSEIPETKDTIEGNAIEKAEFIFGRYKMPCFADDSGLEIKNLNGEPGVYSAMYAGPQRNDKDNINLVLKKMDNINDRSAQFKTIIAYKTKDFIKTFTGVTKGQITLIPQGNKGFGYDPIFVPDFIFENDKFIENKEKLTLANMDLIDKNKISSRAKAFNQFINFLKS